MEPLEYVALALAAFGAGGINAIAGGGTLIGFPVLIAVGYDAKVANVTNTIAIWPGSIGGSLAYRNEITRQKRLIIQIWPFVVVGALAGAILLLATPTSTFELVVPFLIFGACALLLLQDRLTALIYRRRAADTEPETNLLAMRLGVLIVAIYGGYFGAAMGIIMLAVFGLVLAEDIQHANALKGLITFAVNGLAAIYFALFAEVAWEAAAVMVAFSLVGGYIGARVARVLPKDWLRAVATVYGTAAGIFLLVR
jgi:uncharacterized membrane protein YfcA